MSCQRNKMINMSTMSILKLYFTFRLIPVVIVFVCIVLCLTGVVMGLLYYFRKYKTKYSMISKCCKRIKLFLSFFSSLCLFIYKSEFDNLSRNMAHIHATLDKTEMNLWVKWTQNICRWFKNRLFSLKG